MTQFCQAEVQLFDGLSFWVDGNSKITRTNGTYACPAPNALSLPHISCCPGSTPACRDACYVHGLEANAKETYKKYALNAMTLHRVLLSEYSLCKSARLLGQWIAQNCKGGFRFHVSGDVMHRRHAGWIIEVCRWAREIPFWIYTRTLDCVDVLKAKNLATNVSADADNYEDARATALEYDARICYLTRDGSIPADLPEGSVVFPDYSLRGRNLSEPTDAPWWQGLTSAQKKMVCGADFFGQSEAHRCGPCTKCLV